MELSNRSDTSRSPSPSRRLDIPVTGRHIRRQGITQAPTSSHAGASSSQNQEIDVGLWKNIPRDIAIQIIKIRKVKQMVEDIDVNSTDPFQSIKKLISVNEKAKEAFKEYFPNANNSEPYDPFKDQDLSEGIKERFINNSTSEQNIMRIIPSLSDNKIIELVNDEDTREIVKNFIAASPSLYNIPDAVQALANDSNTKVRMCLANNLNLIEFSDDIIKKLAGDKSRWVVNALKQHEDYEDIQATIPDIDDYFLPENQLDDDVHLAHQ